MAGYISLFFDDARLDLPQIKLDQAKANIFSNYKKTLRCPDASEEKNLRDIVQNTILSNMESQMKQTDNPNKTDPIKYWDISLGQMYSIWNENTTELDRMSKLIKYIERVYNTLSDSISKSNGTISKNIIADMKQDREKLKNIQQQLQGFNISGDSSLKGTFFGSLKSIIMKAQGHVHEAAGILAAAEVKKVANKELAKTNKELSFIIEHSGGKLIQDSELNAAVQASDMELGIKNNPKNDITIAVQDGNGKIVWYTGLSLKSTSSTTPQTVKIMTQYLTTLLNKIYDTNTYLNYAAALGLGDWSHRRAGIGPIAERKIITTSGTALTEAWKEIVYNAIYLQIIDMFTGIGTGGVLNDAEYLIINSKPISIYEIFNELESKQTNNIYSIQGVKIGGIEDAIRRRQFTDANIDAFVKDIDHNIMTTDTERILRSDKAWTNIYTMLQNKKITISLKYADVFKGATR